MTKVKICGIKDLDTALYCCEAGADALGFNFAEEAKKRDRYIDPESAFAIIEKLPPFVTTVAVTVNEPPSRLNEYLSFVDLVQLHGEEPPDICRHVPGRCVKAFRASADFDIADMARFPVRAYLLDACVAGARGGTGQRGDWNVARAAVALGYRLILAGGLTPDNVEEAVHTVRPYGVDTAGGVESAPGRKDYDLIKRFISNAKSAPLS